MTAAAVAPTALPLNDEPQDRDLTLGHLRSERWSNPARSLRGADMDCLATARIDGALNDGPVTVGGAGLVLFHGPVEHSPQWVDAVRAASAVAVLVSAAAKSDDLSELARDGLVVAAHARLFHRGPTVVAPAW